MKSKFERYVKTIIRQTDCPEEEKQDLYEELLIHLELSKEDLMRKGLNEREAEFKAMERFGSEKEIGNSLQQSIYPYKRALMLTLTVLSFVFTVSVYLLLIFQEGDALIGWLLLSMSINSLLLMMTFNQVRFLNYRRWINTVLIVHILIHVYGYGVVSILEHASQIPLSILSGMIILLALILIYQTTIYGINLQGNLVKETKRLHQLNFVLGLITIGYLLFFVWSAMMWFEGFQPFMLIMMSPFILWVVLYVAQMILLEKNKRIALLLAFLSILLNVLILVWFFYPLI